MTDKTILWEGPTPTAGRLDKVVSTLVDGLSRQRAQTLIAADKVSVNGSVTTNRSAKITLEDILVIKDQPVEKTHLIAQAIELDIVFEDEAVIVINKPVGMVVHPGAGVPDGTLVNALLHHCGESLTGIGGIDRPGIVHRLDKDTSGVMIAAKTQAAYDGLAPQFADHSIERTYHALVMGQPMPLQGSVNKPIGRHSSQRIKMAVQPEERGGKAAKTHYKLLKRYMTEDKVLASLVECRLETGRTHQVRVHMASLGNPLVGDSLYRGRRQSSLAMLNQFPRQALHAKSLGFVHPLSEKPLYFETDYPHDIHEVLHALDGLSV